MKTFVLAAVAALSALVSAPAMAQDATFTGPRVGATVGYDNVQGAEDVAYGGVAGYDFAYRGVVLGGEVGLEDSTVRSGAVHASRDLAASARIGYVVMPRTMLFAKVGYATTRVEALGAHTNLEGVRFGGGVEFAVTPKTYISTEYRRTEYEGNFGGRDQVMAGVGFRF